MPASNAFHANLARALATNNPTPLLEACSMLASVDPANLPRIEGANPAFHPLAQLAAAFLEADDVETNAVARVWAEMLDANTLDDMMRRRLRVSVDTRKHPAWLDDLKRTSITRASSHRDVFGECETIMLEAQVGEHSFVLACALLHIGGTMLEDTYLIPGSINEATAVLPAEVLDTVVTSEPSLAEVAATLRGALRLTGMTHPPVKTETWPGTKPILDWMLRKLPEGETGWREPLAPDEIDRIVADFARSPEARTLPEHGVNDASLLFSFGTSYGTGDPLRWGPMFVEELLLSLIPRKVMAPDQVLLRMPQVLLAIVAWAHRESNIDAESTAVVLDRIHNLTAEFERLVTQEHQSPLAGGMDGFTPLDYQQLFEDQLAAYVGGAQALSELTATPLPAESFAEAARHFVSPSKDSDASTIAIASDISDRVREIAELIESTGAEYFNDPELVTVALRLLAYTATQDPSIYRRRATNSSTACVLCWITAQNNEWFDGHRDRSRSVKALMATFGVKSPPQDRAFNILRSIGVYAISPFEVILGDTVFLTGAMRAKLIAERDGGAWHA